VNRDNISAKHGSEKGKRGQRCDYVHLNPVRARVVSAKKKLESYRWSSYPAYRRPKLRPPWLRVDRLLGEHGLQLDIAATRREFEQRMKQARIKPGEQELMRRGWKLADP
jgi:hypothetical protein